MKKFNINEAQELKLSADFENTKSDWHADVAKKFLKQMDERVKELNLDREKIYKAVKEFWAGNFPQALQCIWGNKVKSTQEEANGGSEITYTYSIAGYGVFTEMYKHSGIAYQHSIEFDPEDVDNRCYELTHILNVHCNHKNGNFNEIKRQAEEEACKMKSLYIINFLFVGFASRDLNSVFYGLKRKNKIPK